MDMDHHASSQSSLDEISDVDGFEVDASGVLGTRCGRKDLLKGLSVTHFYSPS